MYWPSLSAARAVFYESKTQIKPQFFLGKPDPLLMLEDIAAVYSVVELHEMLYKVSEYYTDITLNKGGAPSLNLQDLVFNFNQLSKDMFPKLFAKYSLYNASVYRRMLRLMNDVNMTCDNILFDQIAKAIKDPMTPEFDMIFRTEAFDYHNE